MTHTNSFQTNKDYYERLFGRRDAPKKNPNANTMMDNASENLSEFKYSSVGSPDSIETYGLALEELRKSRDGIDPKHLITIDETEFVRPLTFKETIEARLDGYKTDSDDEEMFLLLNRPGLTCTGIAYPNYRMFSNLNNDKFKIIPLCKELITFDSERDYLFLLTSYESLEGIELDKTKGIYNELLTKEQVKIHPGWLAAVEGDQKLLSEYADLIFSLRTNKSMMFTLASLNLNDHLRALGVSSINAGYSAATGHTNFTEGGEFVRISKFTK